MKETAINFYLDKALSGDKQARENLIEGLQPFIKKEAQRVCGRKLDWKYDDELSIAMIALNEAIDAYDVSKNDSFTSFARLVIKRRLVDYFRKNTSFYSLPGDEVITNQTHVNEDWEQNEREKEILNYRNLLLQFNISLEMVIKAQPKHRKLKVKLQHIAKTLAEDKELMEYLYHTGKLPRKRLCEKTGITPRMLERSRVYVIALALLLYQESFPILQDYVRELTDKGEEPYEEKS